MEKIIESRLENNTEKIVIFFKKIEKYDRIAIFRHDHPDYDALGTQLGLVSFLNDNFPKKEIVYVGDDHVSLTGTCFPKMMNVNDEWFDKPFLGIVVDLSAIDRAADCRYEKASYLIKIDHHPRVEEYGDLQIIDDTMIAAGELVASMLIFGGKNYKISAKTAGFLYKAIVGDSGRFLYKDTTVHTFFIAQKLLETGIDITTLYNEMYDQKLTDLEVRKYILKTYKITKNGIAYYILTDKILKKYDLVPIQGKDNVNIFAHFSGINAWLSITEDINKGNWRVSIRSAERPIDKIAEKYGGGGHPQASATKLKSLKDVNKLIEELDKYFAK